MPDNTNSQAINFDNKCARTTADSLGSAYQTMLRFQQEFLAQNGAANIPADANNIADGSQPSLGAGADGRKPVTDQQVLNLKSLVDALVTYFQTAVTLNGVTNSRIVWLEQMTTNEAARF